MPNFQDNDFTLVSSADNTKHGRFNLAPFTAATERIFTLPDGSTGLAAVGMSNIFTADQFLNGTLAVRDQIDPTQQFVLAAIGTTGTATTLTTSQTGTRQIALGNDSATLPGIVAPSSATVNKTGQTASIGATTVYTTVHAGLYRMSAYAVFTAVTTPGNLTLSAIYTDPQQAQTLSFNRNNTVAYTVAGSEVDGQLTFYSTTASLIRFSTTLTGIGTYSLYVRVESLT